MPNEKRIALLDTETCGDFGRPLIYDFAYQITNKRGKIYTEQNWLIQEIAENANLMRGAFYHAKIYDTYLRMLNDDKIKLASWGFARLNFLKDCRKYNVDIVSAYNLPFDMRAIKSTQERIQYGKFLNFNPLLLCGWQFACRVLFDTPTYKKMAQARGWISPAGNYRTTAEHAYKFISPQEVYTHSHTALDDVNTERKVLVKCFDKRKRIPYGETGASWQIPNRKNCKSIKQTELFKSE